MLVTKRRRGDRILFSTGQEVQIATVTHRGVLFRIEGDGAGREYHLDLKGQCDVCGDRTIILFIRRIDGQEAELAISADREIGIRFAGPFERAEFPQWRG